MFCYMCEEYVLIHRKLVVLCKSNIKKSIRSWVLDNDEDYNSSYLDINHFVDEFINSSWDKDTSISIEKTFTSNVKNSGRSFFFDNNLIHFVDNLSLSALRKYFGFEFTRPLKVSSLPVTE